MDSSSFSRNWCGIGPYQTAPLYQFRDAPDYGVLELYILRHLMDIK